MEKAIDRPPPNQDDIDEMLEKTINEQYNSRTGATIDYHSAISILNRYCDLLPRDSFTMPTVTWRRIDKPDKKIIVCILLPIQSPVNYEICVSISLLQPNNMNDPNTGVVSKRKPNIISIFQIIK